MLQKVTCNSQVCDPVILASTGSSDSHGCLKGTSLGPGHCIWTSDCLLKWSCHSALVLFDPILPAPLQSLINFINLQPPDVPRNWCMYTQSMYIFPLPKDVELFFRGGGWVGSKAPIGFRTSIIAHSKLLSIVCVHLGHEVPQWVSGFRKVDSDYCWSLPFH